MMLFQNRYRIPSARLPYHDYSAAGWYFVTICTKDKIPFFGRIEAGVMNFSDRGTAACNCWRAIPDHHSHIILDEWVVMPNHMHGILVITPTVETRPGASPNVTPSRNSSMPDERHMNDETRPDASPIVTLTHNSSMPDERHINDETRQGASLQTGNRFGGLKPGALQTVVNLYKGCVTRWCRANGFGHFAWQPRFHDHIIRSEVSLNAIRTYIRDNPANWHGDTEYKTMP